MKKRKENLWVPCFGGGFGGPPRMELERGILEGHAKWSSILRPWSWFFTKTLNFGVKTHMKALAGVDLTR
jgi:hypothetical protein